MTEPSSVQLKTNWIFDFIPMLPLSGLQYWADGDVGHRVLFITDVRETYTVTFEEGMACMDQGSAPGCIHAEHRSKSIYLHQCRGDHDNVCFFRLEWTDNSGMAHIQPGQMVTGMDFLWSNGVEPVLLSIVNVLQLAIA